MTINDGNVLIMLLYKRHLYNRLRDTENIQTDLFTRHWVTACGHAYASISLDGGNKDDPIFTSTLPNSAGGNKHYNDHSNRYN